MSVAKFHWTQSDFDELSAWLKSPEGRQSFAETQQRIGHEGEKILRMRDIPPEKMQTPFYIRD
jgi:hypothetical protein